MVHPSCILRFTPPHQYIQANTSHNKLIAPSIKLFRAIMVVSYKSV